MSAGGSDHLFRVLVLDHTGELGGGELALGRALVELPGDVEPSVLLFAEGPFAERLRATGIPVGVVPMPAGLATTGRAEVGHRPWPFVSSVARTVRFAATVARTVRAAKVDVIHANTLKAYAVGLVVAPLARRPLVWHVHDRIAPDYLPRRVVSVLRWTARRLPVTVVATSQAVADTLPGARHLTVVRPGLGATQVRPFPQHRTPPSPPVVGLVGRISPTKGTDVFVRAAAIVRQRHPDAEFRVVGAALFGEDGYADEVLALVDDLGLAGAVTFTGFVDPPMAQIDAMTVCVHASPVPEPFGSVIVEAMARGVPVVATSGGGVGEIVTPPGEPEPLALLVPPADPQALADAICDVIEHPEQAHERARRAWKSVTTVHTVARTADGLVSAWRSVGRAAARPRVAIAHDYLTQRGGAERVVLALARAFPDAVIHTTIYDPQGTFPEFAEHRVVVSSLNRSALLRRNHRYALPLLAGAASALRVDADVVICSSSGWAHGVRTTGTKLVYCHTPARWVHLTEEYLGVPAHRSPTGLVLLAMRPALRRWDTWAAGTADRYLANSSVVRERIRAAYGIDCEVLYPPVTVDASGTRDPVAALTDWVESGYHLLVSRLLPYKNVGVVVEAFRRSGERLVVVGSGPLAGELRRTAPANVRLVSDLTDAQLRWTYAAARTLVAPSHEDFGLTPLEAMAFGVPAVALRAGGYLDTVLEGVTGVFFDTVDPDAVAAAVTLAGGRQWDRTAMAERLEAFSEERFAERLHLEVSRLDVGQIVN